MDKNKIIMYAFADELEKNSAVPIFSAVAGKILGKSGLKSGLKYMAKTAPRATSTLSKSAPKTITKKPGFLTRAIAEPLHRGGQFLKNPIKGIQREFRRMGRYTKTAKDPKTLKNMVKQEIGKGKKFLGYDKAGRAVFKRSLAGKIGLGFGMSGVGFGAMEFATNKYDDQGKKRSLGRRLARAGGEAALWSFAPTIGGTVLGVQLANQAKKALTSDSSAKAFRQNLQRNNTNIMTQPTLPLQQSQFSYGGARSNSIDRQLPNISGSFY